MKILIPYIDRQIMRLYPNTLTANRYKLYLASLRFKRELDKTMLIKLMRKLLDNLEKRLNNY